MNYSGIKYCDMMNGDGLRTVLFVSGCSHHCPSCHNPQTHDPCYGHQFTIGTMTEIMESLRMEFCSGLTLSGGDPLYPDNRNEVMRIVETVKGEFGNEKTIWLYTGYTYGELKKQMDGGDVSVRRILDCVDVLVDGPFILSRKRTGLHWRGSDNQNILRLEHGKVVHIVGQWEDYKDSVEYSHDSDAMLLRHYEIRVDDVECLRLFNKSVRMCLQDNNKLKLTARFFASDDVVNFLPSFAKGKDHRIVVTQFADDGSWNYNVVDGIFGCKSARIVSVRDEGTTRDELVLEFVQV